MGIFGESHRSLKFSIITTVLNGLPYIRETVGSVLRQTHEDFEHLIIDAGSTDGTLETIVELAEADPRITALSKPGMQMYDAIFLGLDASKGQVLSWINADDLYPPWALARVAAHLNTSPDHRWVTGLPSAWDVNGCLTDVRPQASHPQRLIRQGWFHKDLLGFIQQESIFFSRSLFDQLSADDRQAITSKKLAGDYVLWKRLAQYDELHSIPSVLGGFRRHDSNRSVTGMEHYMQEVRGDGAVFLPPPITSLVRHIYWLYAASAARRAVT